MKLSHKIITFAAVVAGAFSLSSCMSDDSNSTSTVIDSNCAITNFVLGNLNRTIYTKTSDGRDTSYVTAVAGSAYKMHIDQLKQEIFNTDSLPANTDITKVALNSIAGDGNFYYRNDNGSDTLFVSSDSIDFSSPRYFTCVSTDGTQSRTYKVSINVHNSNPEVFSWSTVAEQNDAFDGISSQKMLVTNGNITVMAIKSGAPVALQASTTVPDQWSVASVSGLTEMNPREVFFFAGKLCTIDNGALKTSADGIDWTAVDAGMTFDNIIVATANEIFCTSNGTVYVSNDLQQWQADAVADNTSMLPSDNIACTWTNLAFNKNFYYAMSCGTTADGQSVIWKKTIDRTGFNTEPWVLYPQADVNRYCYPSLDQAVLFTYDSKLVNFGIKNQMLTSFYVSTDGGINWIPQTGGYNLPDNITATSFSAVADDQNFIWIATAPEGKILKGRLNRLSYDKKEDIFLKNIER